MGSQEMSSAQVHSNVLHIGCARHSTPLAYDIYLQASGARRSAFLFANILSYCTTRYMHPRNTTNSWRWPQNVCTMSCTWWLRICCVVRDLHQCLVNALGDIFVISNTKQRRLGCSVILANLLFRIQNPEPLSTCFSTELSF